MLVNDAEGGQFDYDDSDSDGEAKAPATVPAPAAPHARQLARVETRLARSEIYAKHLVRELGKRNRDLALAQETCKRLKAEAAAAQAELNYRWSQRVSELERRVYQADSRCAEVYSRGRQEGSAEGYHRGLEAGYQRLESAPSHLSYLSFKPTPTPSQFLSHARAAALRLAQKKGAVDKK